MTRVADLTGAELAFWVARALGCTITHASGFGGSTQVIELGPKLLGYIDGDFSPQFAPHEDWAQGGPIIERERIDIDQNPARTLPVRCHAIMDNADHTALNRRVDAWGPTPLIAAMRALVASKFGETVTDQEAPCAQ